MNQAHKKKKQLLEELQALRSRVVELEQELNDCRDKAMQERMKRCSLEADIEFIGDFDVINAKGVNISSGGICMRLADDLPFEMRYEQDGSMVHRRAHLIWLKRLETGGYHFGFRFVDNKPFPRF